MRELVVALVFVAAAATNASSQQAPIGNMLSPGETGAAASGLAGLGDDSDFLGVFAGYCHRGLVDAGVIVVRQGYDQSLLGDDGSSLGFGPQVNVHLLRDDERAPVSVMLQGGLQFYSFSSDALDAADADLSAWVLTLGAGAYRSFPVGPQWDFIPSGSLGLARGTLTLETPMGDDSETDTDGFVTFRGTFVYRAASVGWTIDPFVILGDSELIGVFVGALWGSGESAPPPAADPIPN